MIRFESLPMGGLRVIDTLGDYSLEITADSIVQREPVTTAKFPFPVDNAASIITGSISFESGLGIVVRDESGEFIANVFQEEKSFEKGTYYVDISSRSKMYIRVHDAELTVLAPKEKSDKPTRISGDSSTQFDIGVRSSHTQPEGTITTTEDPIDIMRAISYLGSSLKEFSCERAWPTLRGHPPVIELGDTFRVSSSLDKPSTGVFIAVPAEYESIYPIASLAFYLGAEVVEGETPRLFTEDGFEYYFDSDNLGFSAYRVLKHCLVLDNLNRNGGYYEYDSYEAKRLDESYSEVISNLDYNESIKNSIEHYLSIPLDETCSLVPTSGTESVLRDSPEDVELLPFLADQMHCIRTHSPTQSEKSSGQSSIISRIRDKLSFNQNNKKDNVNSNSLQFTESNIINHRATSIRSKLPINVSRIFPEAYRNRLRRAFPDSSEFSVTVICNDRTMLDEAEKSFNSFLDAPDGKPIQMSIEHEVSTEELSDILTSNHQFFYYIGHTDSEGFVCSDGKLDVNTLPYVNVEGFFLNSCNSQEQGKALLKKGSIAGVATRRPVESTNATKVGERLTSLINLGYPLGPAFNIAMKDDPIAASKYQVLGDPFIELRRIEGGNFIFSLSVDSMGPEEHVVTTKSYTSSTMSLGGLAQQYLEFDIDQLFLVGSNIKTRPLTMDELLEYLHESRCAVFLDNGEFAWSDEITANQILSTISSTSVETKTPP